MPDTAVAEKVKQWLRGTLIRDIVSRIAANVLAPAIIAAVVSLAAVAWLGWPSTWGWLSEQVTVSRGLIVVPPLVLVWLLTGGLLTHMAYRRSVRAKLMTAGRYVHVGGWVSFGPLSHKVRQRQYVVVDDKFEAEGPFCTACHGPVLLMGQHQNQGFVCLSPTCMKQGKIDPEDPKRMELQAEAAIVGRCNRIRHSGYEPIVVPERPIDWDSMPAAEGRGLRGRVWAWLSGAQKRAGTE